MAGTGWCERHGPFDGSACPYCERERRRGRPQAPQSLEEDDTPTGYGAGRGGGSAYREQDRRGGDDEEETDPGRRKLADEDETQVPRGRVSREEDDTEVPEPPPELLGWLVVRRGSASTRRGLVFPLKKRSLIGRSRSCQIVLGDMKVSKEHAKVIIENGHFIITDILTPQGTFVNGTKIREATALKENDLVRIGDTEMVLKTLEPDPEAD